MTSRLITDTAEIRHSSVMIRSPTSRSKRTDAIIPANSCDSANQATGRTGNGQTNQHRSVQCSPVEKKKGHFRMAQSSQDVRNNGRTDPHGKPKPFSLGLRLEDFHHPIGNELDELLAFFLTQLRIDAATATLA